MAYDRQKVIDIALAEVGYLEKASNSNLDSDTSNAGYNNYTKFARDLYNAGYYNGNKNGFAWCDVFVDWCFYKAWGKTVGQQLQCQTGDLGAGCGYSAQYYKNKGQLHTDNPQPGDQIFFGSASNVTHTGLVYAVDSARVYTVEGNTSGSSGVVANGGGVFKKSYPLSYSKIYSYGRPDYGDNYKATTTTTLGGTYTMNMNVLRSGSSGKDVKALQILLNGYGYDCGTADGEFGSKTLAAVKKYQTAKKLVVDGVVGAATMGALLGV